jgi:hypothetical protein
VGSIDTGLIGKEELFWSLEFLICLELRG